MVIFPHFVEPVLKLHANFCHCPKQLGSHQVLEPSCLFLQLDPQTCDIPTSNAHAQARRCSAQEVRVDGIAEVLSVGRMKRERGPTLRGRLEPSGKTDLW